MLAENKIFLKEREIWPQFMHDLFIQYHKSRRAGKSQGLITIFFLLTFWSPLFYFTQWGNQYLKKSFTQIIVCLSILMWFWSIFIYFYCSQCFINAFLEINQTLSVSQRDISKMQSLQFCVM